MIVQARAQRTPCGAFQEASSLDEPYWRIVISLFGEHIARFLSFGPRNSSRHLACGIVSVVWSKQRSEISSGSLLDKDCGSMCPLFHIVNSDVSGDFFARYGKQGICFCNPFLAGYQN